MMYLLSLFVGVALAAEKEKTCLRDALGNMGQVTLDTCDMLAKLNACEQQVTSLGNQLQTCNNQGGGGGGGTAATYAAIVQHGGLSFAFGTSAAAPKSNAYKVMHARAVDYFGLKFPDNIHYTYSNSNPRVDGKVTDAASLDEAFSIAEAFGFRLTLTAVDTTYTKRRTVKQVYGNIGDGRDSGLPNGRTMTFTKIEQDTQLRIVYKDNIRVYGNGGVCYWQVNIDGKQCPSVLMRGGMHGAGNDNNDHQEATIGGLCGGINEGSHTLAIALSGNGKDCYTGWDPNSQGQWMFEVREVLNGQHGFNGMTKDGDDGDDNDANMHERSMNFVKQSATSRLRLFYIDNFRAYNGASCTWNIRIDGGNNCKWNDADIIIRQSVHSHGGENDHVPGAFGGWCEGITAGSHRMNIAVDGNGDCYTGWSTNHHLEAVEYEANVPEFTIFQRFANNIDGRDGNGYVNWRTMDFKKKAADTYLRLTYIDNLRVTGHGVWCKWSLHIDGRACSSGNISANRHTASGNNNHFPHVVSGYCKNVPAGNHNMKVYLTSGSGVDCYTGWERNAPHTMTFTMEVEEVLKRDVIGY